MILSKIKTSASLFLATITIVSGLASAPVNSQQVPNIQLPSTQVQAPFVYGEFNDQSSFKEWQKLRAVVSDNPAEVLKTQLNVIDLLFGNAEGNIEFVRKESYWNISDDFWFHMEPGQSKRKQDNLGLVNAGIASVSCFKDRPNDQIINQLCVNILKKQGYTLESFAKLPQWKRVEVYYKAKMAIYLSLQYQAGLRNSSKEVIAELDRLKIKRTTSVEMFFIDQSNQLGLGGVKTLAKIYKGMEGLSQKQILARIRQFGITDANNVFTGGYGQKIDLKPVPANLLRAAFSRVMWHNTRGTSTVFVSGHPWLNDVSRKWTFNMVTKDNPTLKAEIKEYVKENFKGVDFDKLKFSAVQVGDDNVTVQALNEKKVVFSKTMKVGPQFNNFTDQKVAFADPFRRITTLPQSQAEYNTMKVAAKNFLRDEFYQFVK
jgi:hypothetical protein